MRGLLTLLVCFTAWSASAQSDWKKISFTSFITQYDKFVTSQPKENYTVDVTREIFQNKTDRKSMSFESGTYVQGKGFEQCYVSGRQVYVQNDSIRLMIDTVEKQAILSKAANEMGSQYSLDYLKKADSLQYEFFTLKTDSKIEFKVVEVKPVSSNKEIVFAFDKTSKFLKAVSIVYWESNYFSDDPADETKEQPLMRVNYTNFKIVPSTKSTIDSLFDEWVFASLSGFQLVASKSAYQLTDIRKNSH